MFDMYSMLVIHQIQQVWQKI